MGRYIFETFYVIYSIPFHFIMTGMMTRMWLSNMAFNMAPKRDSAAAASNVALNVAPKCDSAAAM